MKVKDLKTGMMLEPMETFRFVTSPNGWLNAIPVSSRQISKRGQKKKRLAVYVGRAADVGNETAFVWSDKYVLFEGRVLGVDPYAWRRIQPVLGE